MLVLLPPSETKAPGGTGPTLDLDALSHPELTPTRRKLVDELVTLASDVPAGLAALGLSERQSAELARNAALRTAPTCPALYRYTGVLYDALDAGSLRSGDRARAVARLAVASALFGLVAAEDPIPAYRLSATSALPGCGSLRSVWRPVLVPVLVGVEGLVVDLRSGAYAALAPMPHAVTVRVLSADHQGRRRTVSHHNKAYKGRLARLLATTRREVRDVTGVARGGHPRRPKDRAVRGARLGPRSTGLTLAHPLAPSSPRLLPRPRVGARRNSVARASGCGSRCVVSGGQRPHGGDQLVAALLLLAGAGLAHGDLSPFNLLVHQGRLVLIDLPQVVDLVANPQGPAFLSRDVRIVTDWFTVKGLPAHLADAEELRARLLREAGLRPGTGQCQ